MSRPLPYRSSRSGEGVPKPEWLQFDAALFLHDQALREYGGIQDLKSEDLLHSAPGKPTNKLANAEPDAIDLLDLAAAYANGLSGNDPFNDGNERTAWGSCVLFLKATARELAVPASEAVERMVRLAMGGMDETAFAVWLRSKAR